MYHLPEGYNERLDNPPWDDSALEEEWQSEVYILARKICLENGYKTVCDLGCGSAFKLLKYLGQFNTVGIDVPSTVEFLKSKYPDRKWLGVEDEYPKSDLLICADVLEHCPKPDNTMQFILNLSPKKIVLSTPERNSRETEPRLGPPTHWPHCREWSLWEFKLYVEDWFKIEKGPCIFGPQFVQQLVVCSLK